MLINYFGHSYFYIQGENYSITLDPYGNIGLKEKSVNADYVFCSHNHYDHNNVKLTSNAKIITENSDNFEIISTYHDEVQGAKRGKNNVLKFILDGKVFVFTGDIGVLDDNVIEKCKGCDYLFLPVGGVYTIDYKLAKEYVLKINPQAVIPMHYKLEGCSVDVAKLDYFTNEFTCVNTVNSPYSVTGNEKNILVIKAEI